MTWHKNCYNRDVNENRVEKREKTGFDFSLKGEQKWPPELFRIKVVSTLLSGSDEFVPLITTKEETWWCNTHERKATDIDEHGEHCCDPNLAGITLSCNCVNLTDIAIIEKV